MLLKCDLVCHGLFIFCEVAGLLGFEGGVAGEKIWLLRGDHPKKNDGKRGWGHVKYFSKTLE